MAINDVCDQLIVHRRDRKNSVDAQRELMQRFVAELTRLVKSIEDDERYRDPISGKPVVVLNATETYFSLSACTDDELKINLNADGSREYNCKVMPLKRNAQISFTTHQGRPAITYVTGPTTAEGTEGPEAFLDRFLREVYRADQDMAKKLPRAAPGS